MLARESFIAITYCQYDVVSCWYDRYVMQITGLSSTVCVKGITAAVLHLP